MSNKSDLLREIQERLTQAESEQANPNGATKPRPKAKPATRAAINKANAQHSTGPKSPEGKQRASANSLKEGFYAALDKLNPYDSGPFHHLHAQLHAGLHPDGPAEEHLVREIAMLSARLQRLESAEHALLCGHTPGEPPTIENPERYTDGELHDLALPDSRATAAAYLSTIDNIERLNKIETHLRRAYNRSWDRLERMQRDRHKQFLREKQERTQREATFSNERPKDRRPQAPQDSSEHNSPEPPPAETAPPFPTQPIPPGAASEGRGTAPEACACPTSQRIIGHIPTRYIPQAG